MEGRTVMMSVLVPFSRLPDGARVSNDMYFRGRRFFYDLRGELTIQRGGYLATDTYFNGLSIGKWRKYTRMENLFLHLRIKGRGRVSVRNDFRVEYGIACHALENYEVDCHEAEEIEIDLSRYLHCRDMISFDVTAYEECTLYSAEYLCSTPPREVNIALSVCTYKREPYVYRLIDDYKTMSDDGVQLFIADNGKSLKDPEVEGVHIFPNKNYGGAGGFTRCMLEIKRYNQTAIRPVTHTVLMDDDILLDVRILKRLQAFLALLKDKYSNYFICGAMCNLEQPNVQYERNSYFRGGNNMLQRGAGYDLREQHICIFNEEDEDLTYQSPVTAGWWFCCINVKVFHKNNYPFPCFFRGDDIEYALRNGSRVITLNGLVVWHEPFYKKFSNTAENYYLPRNVMVIDTLYREKAQKEILKYFRRRMKSCLIQYDYEGMELLNRAMEDFFKGPEFFAKQDAEALNRELSQYNHKMIPFRQALGEYDYGNICWQANQQSDSSKFAKFIRRITLNGYLIPMCFFKDFRISGVGFRGRPYSYFRRRKVFNADTFSYAGYFTQIDKKKAFRLYLRYRKNVRFLKKNFSEFKRVYSLELPKLMTESFWVQYLGIDPLE